MALDFRSNNDETPASPANTPGEPLPDRHRLKMILISSPEVVKNTILTLYVKGFAEVDEWSPPQPTPNPGEVISVLWRNIVL
jgi:hypothetical protein